MLALIITVYTCIFIFMCLTWLCYRWLKNPSIVDVAWPLGLFLSGAIYLFAHTYNHRNLLIATLLAIWSFRLAAYLLITRIAKGHLDKRYTGLSEQWKISTSKGFFFNFQLQGIFIFIISFVFLFAGYNTSDTLSVLDYLGMALVVVGIYGESLADYQLTQFKKRQAGKVCNWGLWQYSRHPNYFFDWLSWCGFFVFGLVHPLGYIGLISPLLLYIIMTKVTGPITEKASVTSRGQAYIDYQAKTSMFFPWLTS